jgi:hypothetical protein
MYLFLTVAVNHAAAQSPEIEIQYTESEKLMINDISITKKTKVEEMEELLGNPSRSKDYPSGETSYFYDETGLVFFSVDGKINGLGINFNWDGDDKFPEQSFTGSLSLAGTTIDIDTKSEAIAGIKTVEFICPIPMLCASSNRKADINCTAAFKDESLTQVVFLLR